MHRFVPVLLVAALLIAFRFVGAAFPNTLPNFQPLSALFFCGVLLAPGWRGFAIPAAIWALTFPLGIGHTSGPGLFLTTLAALTAVHFLGRSLSHRGAGALLVGSMGAALVFHALTNGIAWIADPRYAKTLTGLWQSVWAGAPGDVLPTWVFLRNLVAANVLFTGLILLARFKVLAWPRLSIVSPQPVKVRTTR